MNTRTVSTARVSVGLSCEAVALAQISETSPARQFDNGRPWTTGEVDELQRLAPRGAAAVAKALGRSERAIRVRAAREGISLRMPGQHRGRPLGLVDAPSLCPRCAMAEATESTGFCEACTAAHTQERYLEKRTAEAEARRETWHKSWDRERQRDHRLKTTMRPAEAAPPETDPLELGKRALDLLANIRIQSAYQRGLREEAAELVRQLAWGPSV